VVNHHTTCRSQDRAELPFFHIAPFLRAKQSPRLHRKNDGLLNPSSTRPSCKTSRLGLSLSTNTPRQDLTIIASSPRYSTESLMQSRRRRWNTSINYYRSSKRLPDCIRKRQMRTMRGVRAGPREAKYPRDSLTAHYGRACANS
jgi:hypothetical protein